MPLDETAYLKRATLGLLGRFEAMAQRRFGDEALAGEAAGFVLDALAADDWRRVRAHRGEASLATYLVTVAARLLEDFARARFGRVRVPDWVRARGALWERVYRLLCLERQDPEAVLTLAGTEAPDGPDPALVGEALRGIRARYPNCGERGPGEVPLADPDAAADPDGTGPLAAPGTPEQDCLEAERAALLAELRTRFLASGPDPAGRGDRSLGALPPFDLAAEERLLLRLVFEDGLQVTQAGAMLGLSANQAHGRLRRLLGRIRQWLAESGLALGPEDFAT